MLIDTLRFLLTDTSDPVFGFISVISKLHKFEQNITALQFKREFVKNIFIIKFNIDIEIEFD